ncbi:M3 family oligoendopeptidase [Lacticigenium naphthae]|uniref:M3 family oligoendopeptidase n=1 Tax=Lacticigenium naphthae TaxID=515351 RepID=UPI0006886381|nr:M3 family oligoendopeptidase [Lacticigenium naphthae]
MFLINLVLLNKGGINLYSQNWDLDSLFPGIHSTELENRFNQIESNLAIIKSKITSWNFEDDALEFQRFQEIIHYYENLSVSIEQVGTYLNGVISADVQNQDAKMKFGKLSDFGSQFDTVDTLLSKKISMLSDIEWSKILEVTPVAKRSFVLSEKRDLARDFLSEEEETIINALSVDGIHGWSQHYDSIVSHIKIPYTDDKGMTTELSVGQAQNKMYGHPDPFVRQDLFEKWESGWGTYADLFSDTLNHLAGFRLADYKLHNNDNILKKPLEYNRMSEETLDTMWSTISENKKPFINYLERKAALMDKEKLGWQDIESPVLIGDSKAREFSFDDGAAFIIEHFEKFSPKMASFAQNAFENNWIEAEDRSGKAPGGYCSSVPEHKESRIFMTYSNSSGEVATLAHELGHAFHSHVLFDLPVLNQQYAMNVAETASTFAELIIADATVKNATDPKEKITLLDNKIQNALAMFLNIHARFIFEKRFYEERKNGMISSERLNEFMIDAQKEAFGDSLSSYHPSFWASKLHFYISGISFYNFPYTFGFLFSLGIYAYSLKKEQNFEDDYIALLRDTGTMTTEKLAQKHLGVDLTEKSFWENGIAILEKDVELFLELTEEHI